MGLFDDEQIRICIEASCSRKEMGFCYLSGILFLGKNGVEALTRVFLLEWQCQITKRTGSTTFRPLVNPEKR